MIQTRRWFLGLLFLVVLLLPLTVLAQTNLCTAQPSDGGAYQYDPFGNNCHTVTNNTGGTICVFTGEQDHWNRFVSGPWGGIGIGDCGPSYPPAQCSQGGQANNYSNWCNGGDHWQCAGGDPYNQSSYFDSFYWATWYTWDCYDQGGGYTSCGCYD